MLTVSVKAFQSSNKNIVKHKSFTIHLKLGMNMPEIRLGIPAKKEENMDEKVVSSMIQAAKTNSETTEKLTNMLMESIDRDKFKKMLLEEALKDSELRNKIMLELIKKL